jgi:hypothetical protein
MVTPSRGLLLHYAFQRDQGRELTDQFMNAFIDGYALDEVPQASVLRKHLAHLAATTQTTLPATNYYASAIKAWNLWLDGRHATKRKLTWMKTDPFPTLAGLTKS